MVNMAEGKRRRGCGYKMLSNYMCVSLTHTSIVSNVG